MATPRDLSSMLQAWPFVSGSMAARRFKGRDGTDKLQLRVDLGILQMNATGRPDGKQPLGHPTWLHVIRERLASRTTPARDGVPVLTPDEFARIHQESIQFHHRSVCLLQLNDLQGVEADCAHNREIFDLLHDHAPSREVAWPVLQILPQQTLLLARARVAHLKPPSYQDHLRIIEDALAVLDAFFQRLDRPDWAHVCPERIALSQWREQVVANRPLSALEQLGSKLADAIQREDYELAALLRDQIKKLGEG